MITQEKFDRTVASLYQAALADVEWASAATRVNDLIGAHGHSLTYADLGRGGEPEICLARFFVGTGRREDLELVFSRLLPAG